MRPVKYTGNSANIAFYSTDTGLFPLFQVEVLRDAHIITRDADGGYNSQPRAVPRFHFRVRRWDSERNGNKEVARFTYEPKTRPRTDNLSERTVTRVLKEHGL